MDDSQPASPASSRPPPVNVEDKLPTTTLRNDDVRRISDIKAGIEEISSSDRLDKETALQVTRLFHAVEMLLRHECNQRDATIQQLHSTLELDRVQHQLDRFANRALREEAVAAAASMTPNTKRRYSLRT